MTRARDLADYIATGVSDTELDILDGLTSTTAELNYNDTGAAVGTVVASKTVTVDANKDASSFRNLTMAGNLSIGGDVVTTSNATLDLAPNGTGTVVVRGNNNSGAVVFNCESNSHGQKVYGQPHSAGVTNTLMLPEGANSKLVSLVSTDTLTNKTLTSPKINEDVAVTATATEINLIDGGTSRGTTAVADGDGFLTNDGGTMRMTKVDTLATYMQNKIIGGTSIVTTGALDSGSITSGFGTINTGASAITTTGAITGGSFVIGSADINENDLESIDGITAGTVAASKAVVVDTNKDISSFRNVTLTGELDAGSLDVSGDANIAGEVQTTKIAFTDGDDAMTITDTGLVEFNTGFNIGSDAAGDVLYNNGSKYVRLAKGTNGHALVLASGVPSWAAVTTDISGKASLDGATFTGAIQANGGVVFNEGSADVDFRVESNGNANMLFVDGGNDSVGIGTATPLVVNGVTFTGTHLMLKGAAHTRIVAEGGSSGQVLLTDLGADANTKTKFMFSDGGKLQFGSTNDAGANTLHMQIDSTGAVNKPLQPAFLAKAASNQNNLATDTTHTVVFGTEIFDQNADFASNTFTAPVTGRYQLNMNLRLNTVDTAAEFLDIRIVTSNRAYQVVVDIPRNFSSDADFLSATLSVLADMDASDTSTVTVFQDGGNAVLDVNAESQFSGFLAC